MVPAAVLMAFSLFGRGHCRRSARSRWTEPACCVALVSPGRSADDVGETGRAAAQHRAGSRMVDLAGAMRLPTLNGVVCLNSNDLSWFLFRQVRNYFS